MNIRLPFADGGLVRNLPVEVAREMSADVIIAVNVGAPLLPRESLSTAFGVAQQMINILVVQHTRTWLNSWGAEWINEAQIGDVRRFSTAISQPLGPGSRWFVEGGLQTVKSDYDIFGAGLRRTGRITNSTDTVQAGMGLRLGDAGVGRITAGYERYTTAPTISESLDGTMKDRARFVHASASIDTLDDANFPRRGYLLGAAATRYHRVGSDAAPLDLQVLQAMLPVTYGRLTRLGIASAGRYSDARGAFALGGFLNLSGTPIGAVYGPNQLAGALLAYYRMDELPKVVGRNWYTGISVEASNAWENRSDICARDLRKARSIFLGLDTIIGAMYLESPPSGPAHSPPGP